MAGRRSGGGVLGLVAGINPALALAMAVAAAFVPIVFARPIFGLCTLVFLSFLESFSGVAPSISFTKIVGLLLVLGWIGTLATASPAERARRSLLTHEPLLGLVGAVRSLGCRKPSWAEPRRRIGFALALRAHFRTLSDRVRSLTRPRSRRGPGRSFRRGCNLLGCHGMLGPAAAAEAATGRLTGVGLNPNQLGHPLDRRGRPRRDVRDEPAIATVIRLTHLLLLRSLPSGST